MFHREIIRETGKGVDQGIVRTCAVVVGDVE